MTWKVLKLVAVIMSLAGIVWFGAANMGLFWVGYYSLSVLVYLSFVEFLSLQLSRAVIKGNKSTIFDYVI